MSCRAYSVEDGMYTCCVRVGDYYYYYYYYYKQLVCVYDIGMLCKFLWLFTFGVEVRSCNGSCHSESYCKLYAEIYYKLPVD
jgi:hypothetical protein